MEEEHEDRASELYEAIGPQVLRLGHRYFGADRQAAEDLVSETFGRVIAGLPHFRQESSIRTWVFRIALNVAAEWTRRSRSRSDRETVHARSMTSESPVSGLDELLDRERDQHVGAALMRLSEEHRMILSLVVVEGMKRSEISELLGVPEGTLWSRYARARVAFARELEHLGVIDRNQG